jgi:uncharacterized protein YyaL (SSP411 family)
VGNRLSGETSPYLLQHAGNPVDWYPWGPEALERARSEDRPIFLSIGYSACHWCHVMERESFEDPRVAELLRRHFVSIKVDREERPDVDELYMKAVTSTTGSGGWPMSVFLTPALEPFHCGTYYPPVRQYGRPSFLELVATLGEAWQRDRGSVAKRGQQVTEMLRREARAPLAGELDPAVLDRSLAMLSQAYDDAWGGFGGPPKFPHAMDVRLCLRHHARTRNPLALAMARHSLERMARGGICDQLGGGFHRYSTDERWLIPHFEKMLYDNALLVPAYLEGWLVTRDELFARTARGACEWMLREMRTPEGAFASTQDADSEGEEGRFFVWTPAELEALLGRELGRRAAAWWGVSDAGNFEHGASALWRERDAGEVARELKLTLAELEASMEQARATLLAARARRVAPATDDKVLASWNGLAISALAQAAQVLDEPRFHVAARDAADFVLRRMRREDGRLFATARHGRARHEACLDDYAFVVAGLIDLYESDFDARWLEEALALCAIVAAEFADGEHGGWFTTGARHESLLVRLKSPQDGALPSGNGVHALNLLRLAELTGRADLARAAQGALTAFGALVNRHPAAFSQLLMAVDFVAAGPREIVVSGARDDARTQALLHALRTTFLPQRVVARADADAPVELLPLLEGKLDPASPPRAFVCRHWSCRAPVDSVDGLIGELTE